MELQNKYQSEFKQAQKEEESTTASFIKNEAKFEQAISGSADRTISELFIKWDEFGKTDWIIISIKTIDLNQYLSDPYFPYPFFSESRYSLSFCSI